jgi:hypothetical protein
MTHFSSSLTNSVFTSPTRQMNTPLPASPSLRTTALARHPSRYRLSFTVVGHSAQQQLYLDELHTLARQPPRPREISTSLAVAHHSSCTEISVPRRIVTSHLTILGVSTPVTTIPLKVCPACLPSHPKIARELNNQMYATIPTPTTNTWTTVNITVAPQFYSLPPAPCTRDHNPACPHTHCQDATNCTCNLQSTTTGPTPSTAPCTHQHCPDSDYCTCTQQIACIRPADHVFTIDTEHDQCGFPHCHDPAIHLRDPATDSNQSPCPNPALHEQAQVPRIEPKTIILSTWADQQMESFSISTHSVTFTTSCKNLVRFCLQHQQYENEFPPLDLDAYYHQRPDHASPRGIVYVVLQLHSLELVQDESRHLDHNCLIVNCPLHILASLRNANNTASGVSFTTLLRLTRERMAIRLSQQG